MTDGQNEMYPTPSPGGNETVSTYNTQMQTMADTLQKGPDGVTGTYDDVEIYVVGYFCTDYPNNFCQSALAASGAHACPSPTFPTASASDIDTRLNNLASSTAGSCDHYYPLGKDEPSQNPPDAVRGAGGTHLSRAAHPMISSFRSRRSERSQGQALVEFAITLPLFAFFVMVVIQLSIVFIAYYSETRMARETARWLAINSDSTDAQVAAHVQSTMLPGLVAGTPALVSTGTSPTPSAGNPNPAYTPTVYTVGRMTVRATPCGAASSPCTHYERDSGQTIYVEMSYDVSNLLFLPSTFQLSPQLKVAIPTGLPAYRVYVMVE